MNPNQRMLTLTWITAMTLLVALAICIALRAQGQTTHFRHYKLIDIGTFGGPASYINAPFALGAPNQISNPGTVVGSASTDSPTALFPSKAICGGVDGIVPFIFHAFEWQDGEKRDLGALGALPAEECSEAVSINANGEIAGRSGNGIIDPLVDAEEIRAVVWKNGEIKDLGTLGGNHSIATAINNRSQVVGFSVNKKPDPFSLLYALGGFTTGTETRGFLYDKGHMRDLGTLGGPDSQAFSLNERGQTAGISYTNSIPNPITGLPTADPFLWSEGRGMIDLGTLGGVWGTAGSLNNRAQVVGSSSVGADPGACIGIGDPANCHPFFWNHGKLIDLNTETIGGSPNSANALNDAGEVVGNASFPGGDPFGDAYLWKDGAISDLGNGDCYSEAFAINSRGQVVGQSFSCVSNTVRTFLWENGSTVDLNSISSPEGFQLIEAFAITDDGKIGGIGVPPGCPNLTDDRCGHAYVLIPVCEDGTEGCADAPLDPAIVAQSRSASGAEAKKMSAEELAIFKQRIARMAGRNRGFGFWPRR